MTRPWHAQGKVLITVRALGTQGQERLLAELNEERRQTQAA